MAWASANWKGTRYSRMLKRVLTKYQNAYGYGLKLNRGYRPPVGLIIGDTSPTGQVTAEMGAVAVRYSTSVSMAATPCAVYLNTDGTTTWVIVSA